jgi:hypothetical protein
LIQELQLQSEENDKLRESLEKVSAKWQDTSDKLSTLEDAHHKMKKKIQEKSHFGSARSRRESADENELNQSSINQISKMEQEYIDRLAALTLDFENLSLENDQTKILLSDVEKREQELFKQIENMEEIHQTNLVSLKENLTNQSQTDVSRWRDKYEKLLGENNRFHADKLQSSNKQEE